MYYVRILPTEDWQLPISKEFEDLHSANYYAMYYIDNDGNRLVSIEYIEE